MLYMIASIVSQQQLSQITFLHETFCLQELKGFFYVYTSFISTLCFIRAVPAAALHE